MMVKLFADGADLDQIRELAKNPLIQGFTTNPSLMRKAGVKDYEKFCREAIEIVTPMPISLEVFADTFPEMIRQGRKIASWGSNVYVKIPVTDTQGNFAGEPIGVLSEEGIRLNITALTLPVQVDRVCHWLFPTTPAYVSVFAGRIADTGVDPQPIMMRTLAILDDYPSVELIWASPREVLNIEQAEGMGCHAITVTAELLAKRDLLAKDLEEYSLETVQMFHRDATEAGYKI